MNADFEKLAARLLKQGYNKSAAAIAALPEADRGAMRVVFEGIAERAAWLSRYAEERNGYGAGDQGHKAACKAANRAAKMLWCNGFGYNSYIDVNPDEPKSK